MKLCLVAGKYSFPLKFAVFALLCLLSTVAHLSLDRYFTVGGQLLGNSDFSAGPEQWEVRAPGAATVSFDSGEARIHSTDPAIAPAVSQTVPAALLVSWCGWPSANTFRHPFPGKSVQGEDRRSDGSDSVAH